MGMDPRKFPKEMRDKLGITIGAGGHAAPKVSGSVPGMIVFLFKGDPPRATHHAKTLARRGTRTILVNSPELEAAWHYYLSQIPDRADYVAIAGPVVADVAFHFEITDEKGPDILPGLPMLRKPDRDNAAKVAFDALAQRGYLVDDAHVTDGSIKKRWAAPGEGRVVIHLRTMASAADVNTVTLGPNQRAGEIHPVPWMVAHDVAVSARPPLAPRPSGNGHPRPERSKGPVSGRRK